MAGETWQRPTLLLVDGHALVYRAFFAMPALSNSRGEITNAAFGFTSMLLKAFAEIRPAYVVAAFDPPGPTFRHQADASYKATRAEMPADLRPQMGWAREIVEAIGIPIVEIPGFEADDVIGTMSIRAVEAGLDVVIVTGDIDMLQLVNQHVRVFINRRGITETTIYDVDSVFDRFGFPPPLVADYKALQGDVSDNIPGVPGIGTKTAMSLLQEYGPLENVLAAAPSMKAGSKIQRVLTEHAQQARHSKMMTTIRCDMAEVNLDRDTARIGGYDETRVRELFERLEFRSLLPRLPEAFGHGQAPVSGPTGQAEITFAQSAVADVDVEMVENAVQAQAALDAARDAGRYALRTVVMGLPRQGQILGLVAAPQGGGRAYWFPLGDDDTLTWHVEQLLGASELIVDGYDLKRELLAWGGRLRSRLGCDVMLAAYVDNTRVRVPPLPVLGHDLCGLRLEAEESLLGGGRQKRSMAEVAAEELAEYYGQWIGLIEPVKAVISEQLRENNLLRLHDDLELPLVPILAAMERVGIRVDGDMLGGLSVELQARIGTLEAELHALAGYQFNLGSTQQLAKFLYDDLGLAAGRKTKTGRSTDAESLETLRDEHTAVNLLLEWRQLTKLKTTYVDALPNLCSFDGRVHTSFNQAVAATGRLSSADPNLQNVPIRTPWGQRIRRAFIADSGMLLVSADYSQVELRVLAHVTGEDDLIASFARGEDIHRRTAAEVYGVEPANVSADQRRIAKVVNFGVVYGLSDFGLARDTGMSREEAAAFISAYFANFPKVTQWLERTRQHARQWGWVATVSGRRRHLPDIRAANRTIRQAAERMAVNMPIQGGAADIMKKAMIDCAAALRRAGSGSRLLLQVHDELVLEVPAGEVDELVPLVRSAMSEAEKLSVPLVVDVKLGQNWQEMRPVAEVAATSG